MDVVVNQLEQKPHDVPQYEGGDQVPVYDVPQTSDAPKPRWREYIKMFPKIRSLYLF